MKIIVLFFISMHIFVLETMAQAKVGIGTNSPQQMFSVAEGIVVDQNNANKAALLNGIRFGSNSTEGIASNRELDYSNVGTNNLIFFTSNTPRMVITRNGEINIGNDRLSFAKLNIAAEARYNEPDYSSYKAHLEFFGRGTGTPQYLVMGSDNYNGLSFIRAEKAAPYVNLGSLLNLQWQSGSKLTIGDIINPVYKMEVAGDVRLSRNLLVQSDKAILRSADSVHRMRQIKPITVSATFSNLETKFIDFTWPVPFTAAPDCYVGNITSGTGGWAECVLSVALVTTTGARLYIFNPRSMSFSPNFTVNIIAFGPVGAN